MANPFAKTLIGLVAACIVQGAASAQDAQAQFDAAIKLIRLPDSQSERQEEGYAKLVELIDDSPSAEAAFEIWKSTDPAIFQMLIENERTRNAARHLLRLARSGRAEMSRNQAVIDDLIEQALSDDYQTRSAAIRQLAADHGEFAVPALARILADPDAGDEQNRAMLALIEIGRPAVMPLIRALEADNEVLRRNAAAVLVNIGDRRAAGALADLAQSDPSEAVRYIAQKGLDSMDAAGADPARLLLAEAEAYISNDGVREGDHSPVVWSWTENGLVATDVPSAVYHFELAKHNAQQALTIDPANETASAVLARAYTGQIAAIEEGAAGELSGQIAALRRPAMALGADALNAAVEASVRSGQVNIAEATIGLLGEVETNLETSALADLLRSDDTRLRYSAALALSNRADEIAADGALANSLVSVLAQGVTEESMRAILVIDNNPLTRRVAREASAVRGVSFTDASSGTEGMADFYNFPAYDVVVVSDALEDTMPQDIISIVRKRSDNAKVVLLASREDAEERFGDKVDAILRPDGALTTDALLAQVNAVVDDLEPLRARADRVASAAGGALAVLGNKVDTGRAADNLANQLDRDDEVAIPAALALGDAGSAAHAAALIDVVVDGERSDDVRTAAAVGLGGVMNRMDTIDGAAFDQLLAVVTDGTQDAELRGAIATALGKGRLAPGMRVRLTKALSTIAGAGSDI